MLRNGRAIAISKTEPPLWPGVSLRRNFWGKQMRVLTTIAIAAGLAAMPAAAHAVDLLTVPTSTNESLPVADSGFDWNRFYAGVYGVGQSSAVGGGQFRRRAAVSRALRAGSAPCRGADFRRR